MHIYSRHIQPCMQPTPIRLRACPPEAANRLFTAAVVAHFALHTMVNKGWFGRPEERFVGVTRRAALTSGFGLLRRTMPQPESTKRSASDHVR